MSLLKQEYGLTIVLAGLCALGAVCLGAEWMLLDRSATQIQARLDGESKSALLPENLSANDFLMKPKEQYAQQVERPLFIQTRRPLPPPEPVDETPAPAPKTPPGKIRAKLMGIIDVPSGRKALIYDIKKRRYVSLQEGEKINGWRLTSLSSGKAVLRQGLSTEEILLRKPKPKSSPKQAVRRKIVRQKVPSPN